MRAGSERHDGPDPSNGRRIEMDLRHLPAPEPLVRALEAVDALPADAVLSLWTPMMPVPLLQALAGRDLQVDVQVLPDGSAGIEVRHRPRRGGHGPARS